MNGQKHVSHRVDRTDDFLGLGGVTLGPKGARKDPTVNCQDKCATFSNLGATLVAGAIAGGWAT